MVPQFDLNSRQRHFVAHGGGMMSVCATTGALLALRAAGIAPTSFTDMIGWSAGHFVAALVAGDYTLEQIVAIIVQEDFATMFPRVRGPGWMLAHRLYQHGPALRRYALRQGLYQCSGLTEFSRRYALDGFPEKLSVLSVNELGEIFAFTGRGTFFHPQQGGSLRLGNCPVAIEPISRATTTIPGIMPALTCGRVIEQVLGPEALSKLYCADSHMLDGSLAMGALDSFRYHHSIDRSGVVACWPGGEGGNRDLRAYRWYRRLLQLPKLDFCEVADRNVGLFLAPPVDGIRALDFGATAGYKLHNIIHAMRGTFEQLAGCMDIPTRSEIDAEERRICTEVDCQPVAG